MSVSRSDRLIPKEFWLLSLLAESWSLVARRTVLAAPHSLNDQYPEKEGENSPF